MPAPEAVVFDAFHHQHWRRQWDSLVRNTRISGGGEHPFVGAVTDSGGAGLLRGLSMRTCFVTYQRPRLAAAAMQGESFPFSRWAASMKHLPGSSGHSVLAYTYTFEVKPRALRWLLEPVVRLAFNRQTRRRFERLQQFLHHRAGAIEQWQREGGSA